MSILDALFVTNTAAALATTAFLAYYMTSLRWERGRPGRFIVAGVSALATLCWVGVARRVDTWDRGHSYTDVINIGSCLAYSLVAVVFGVAVVAIWRHRP